MIKTRAEYLEYLKKDRLSLGVSGIKSYLFNDIWRFQRSLRKYEYHANTGSFFQYWYRFRYESISRSLGFTIPINVFGPGLSIAHRGTIVVNGKARIGENCRLHVCVNIGADALNSSFVPKIGDNCYIGPGAKLYGNIVIGNNVGIGANAVVNKSFSNNCVIAGVPAKIISEKKLSREKMA